MEWKHLAGLALGAACITVSVLVPATAAVLAPVGGTLLLATNAGKAMKRKPKPCPQPEPDKK